MSEQTKFKKVSDGHQIKVGDVVMVKHAFGTNKHFIKRVTKTQAIADKAKFPNVYCFGFSSIPRYTWDNNEYTVYEPLK